MTRRPCNENALDDVQKTIGVVCFVRVACWLDLLGATIELWRWTEELVCRQVCVVTRRQVNPRPFWNLPLG